MSQLVRSARRSAAVCALLALTLGCGDSGSTPAASQPAEPAQPAEPSQPATPAQPAAPAEPAPADAGAAAPGVAAQGAPHYALYCATCHGDKGCGDGPLSASLDPKPARHCDGNVMNALSDDYLFKVIKQGGAAVDKSPLMAPWGGTLTDPQIRDVVAFVRSLAVPPYSPKS